MMPRVIIRIARDGAKGSANLARRNFARKSPKATVRYADDQSLFTLPAKLPFFKSHRKTVLEEKVSTLISRGPIDDAIEAKLGDFAVALGLKKSDASDLLVQRFTTEVQPIKQRMESSWVLTDSDLEQSEALKRKYNIRLSLSGNAPLFRAIFLT